jgi:hypothetical protein
MKKDIQHFSS